MATSKSGSPIGQHPRMFRVRQKFRCEKIQDARTAVHQQLATLALRDQIQPGQTVALTAGSRGIHQIGTILGAAAEYLKGIGAEPFIVPAMGSHGGGTDEGQIRVLKTLGVTEDICGCPIRSSMDTVVVCESAEGFPVHFDRIASEADHVLVCNRIKPHTRFTGDLQSGLMKMMLIGLGKHHGAEVYHGAIQDYTFGQIVRSVAQEVRTRCRIVAGLAIVENAHDETALIEAVAPTDFEAREIELLKLADRSMARLPFDDADILLVNEIGKNISGTGMDTNVIGRKHNDHAAVGDERPRIRYVVVRGLTEATHGNATGIGAAEFTLRRVVEQIDPVSTTTNCVTSNHPTAGMVPIAYDTDQQVLEAVLRSIGLRKPIESKILWIQDTLQLTELECSEAYWDEAQSNRDLEVLNEPRPFPFDERGDLPAGLPGV